MAANDLRFDTGRVCLDLLATVGSRLSANPVERLDSPDRLAIWLHRTGIVPDDQPLKLDAAALTRFIWLRTCLHRVVHSELAGTPISADDIGQLNHIAAAGLPVSQLARLDNGELKRHLATPLHVESLLAVVGQDAVHLLSSPERALLRECEGPTCDLVYLDTSRGHRRRWCSAAACANKHYVAVHRTRKAGLG